MLESYGLLGPDLFANSTTAEEAKLLKKHDIWISTTPDTENQMGLGAIECFRDDMQASLGVDCKSIAKPLECLLHPRLAHSDDATHHLQATQAAHLTPSARCGSRCN